jgi:opacity protein-like surface antigen
MFMRIAPASFALGSIAALCLSSAAYALDGDPGAYVGASYGQAQTAVDKLNFDESDSGYKVFFGYTFNQYSAIELGYVNGGKPKLQRGTTTIEVTPTAVMPYAIGRYPIGKSFAAFGKFGVAFYDTDTSSDVDLALGLGAMMSLWESFEVRIEYETVAVKDGGFSMLSLGGVYKF